MTDINPQSVKPKMAPDPHQAVYDPTLSYSDEETAIIRQRQVSRSRLMGVLLIGMCILFFGITVVKIGFM